MIITVASGKGGTGKTTIAVNLSLSIDNVQLLDCDVEEPNAALFLNPVMMETKNAVVPVPLIDKEKCAGCGRCRDVCEHNALAVLPKAVKKKPLVLLFPELCHGCGACSYFCPHQAIVETERSIGFIEFGQVGKLQFVHGRLNIGESMAPPVIRQVKQYMNPTRTVIIDAAPGTSCPVITATRGTDFCILVTETTPFGYHDLKLAVETMRTLKIPCGVVINRCDLGDENTWKYCREEKIPVLMEIPFSQEIAGSYARGEPMVDLYPEYRDRFRQMFEKIKRLAGNGSERHKR